MKLLAIDTSTEIASVALYDGQNISCEEQASQRTHAQLLLPMIDRLMTQSNVLLNQLDGIIFGCGPGSFTGLRIACSVAKGLAYAHELDLIPVSSLAAIAWAAREQTGDMSSPIVAFLDARMQEMYWGYYPVNQWMVEERVTSVQDIKIPVDESVILAGAGIDLYWEGVPEYIKNQTRTKLEIFPNAAAMIRLAQHAGIKPVPVAEAQPVYVRNQVTQGDSRG